MPHAQTQMTYDCRCEACRRICLGFTNLSCLTRNGAEKLTDA